MLLILEVILTAWVCVKLDRAKKKWGYGLIPFAVCLLLGLILGIVIGASAITASSTLYLVALVPDILMVIVLLIMGNSLKPVR